ncbi:hypothetical protein CHELV3228_0669 [Campylobacter helveticus]|nr:hypothetical protein CHELV3228_0669 [Campylobacter helveticus]SMC25467.1 hypothetical protein SAMN02745125_02004 [Campylobacter helveticus]SUW82974.1 Uncharacterised protein [Campylobacter helveticus]
MKKPFFINLKNLNDLNIEISIPKEKSMSLYKKCEVCGAKINKLQNISNIFLLGFGKELLCKNCKAKYRANSLFIFCIAFLMTFCFYLYCGVY